MAIQNYVRPQLTIEQVLAILPEATLNRLTPIVIGPQYLLNRYGSETTPGETFLSAGQTVDYKYTDSAGSTQTLPSTYVVDLDSVKLYGEDMEAEYAHIPTGHANPIKIESIANSHILRIDTVTFAGGTLDSTFSGRDMVVGDLAYINDGNRIVKRTVIGLRGTPTAASYGSDTDGSKDDTELRNSAYNPATLASEFTITVTQGGTAASGDARVNISSKSGLYSATNVTPVNASAGSPVGTAGDFQIADAALAGAVLDIRGPSGASSALVVGQVFKIQILHGYDQLDTNQAALSDTGSGYTGPSDTTYLVRVTTGTTGDVAEDAVVEISDTAGLETVTSVTVPADGTDFLVGTYGLQMNFDVTGGGAGTVTQGGLRAGDIYYVHAVAAGESTTEFNGAVLDGPAVDTSLFSNPATAIAVKFRIAYTGEIPSTSAADGVAWSADADEITVDPSVALEVPARDSSPGDEWVPFVDQTDIMPPATISKIYASYRAIVPTTTTEDKILIETTSDITDNLGTQDLDNDLAYGAKCMLNGANGKSIYALRTAGDTVTDYTNALKKLESTDGVYALAPMTTNLAVMQAVASHCESMSTKEEKNFRRCYVATDSPGSYAVLKPATGSPNYTATVGDYSGQGNLLVTSGDSTDFTTLDIGNGDRFILTGASDTEYEIDSVLSATEILLKTGPTSPINPAESFELWRADTPESQVDYVAAQSKALASRRAINVWVENGTALIDGVSTIIPNRYIAAEIAGLRCAVLPQQGLSMTEIQTITNAPSMYVRYNRTDLDRAAENGTFIITQEAESGDVFIRHQLTTDVSNGSLYYEDSAGVNIDDISFKLKDVLNGYVGKKNVTEDTLNDIYNDCWTVLNDASQTERSSDFGPQLNGFEDPVVAADAVLKDRVNVDAVIFIPLPLNQLVVTVEGTVDFDL